ncbi:MAG TPA: N-acetylmuramoyl-L-alanine amidase [Acidobacteriaceae bacterium]|nr:N-acetylmuramoyl-L-alanine amidase [Acidobacteriaceae bacterium]
MRTGSKFVVCLLTGAGLLMALCPVKVSGQEPTAAQPHSSQPRTVVLIDPAHGGTDPGADLGNKVAEKDVTLALATKLRTALAAQDFTVVLTREPDATAAITADQRAQTANRSRALACISLHATRSGSGIHIYTSALEPVPRSSEMPTLTRWDSAQQEFVDQSIQLAGDLKSAFAGAALPADVRTATVPPLDSLMCPAVAVEFAPIENVTSPGKGADAASYQDAAVKAMAAGLGKWRAGSAAQSAAPGISAAPPAKDAQ